MKRKERINVHRNIFNTGVFLHREVHRVMDGFVALIIIESTSRRVHVGTIESNCFVIENIL